MAKPINRTLLKRMLDNWNGSQQLATHPEWLIVKAFYDAEDAYVKEWLLSYINDANKPLVTFRQHIVLWLMRYGMTHATIKDIERKRSIVLLNGGKALDVMRATGGLFPITYPPIVFYQSVSNHFSDKERFIHDNSRP